MVDEYKIEERGLEILDDIKFYHNLIDKNNDFYFPSVVVLYNGNKTSIFRLNEDEFKKVVKFIIKKYENSIRYFISVIDYGEAFLSVGDENSFKNSHPNLRLLIDIFSNKNLLNRLVWRGQGLNPKFISEIEFQPITKYLGMNIEHCFDISQRKFTHNFLSLYRAYKEYREEFHCFIEQSGVIEKTLYSYNSEFNTTSPWTYDYKVSLESKSVDVKMLLKPGEYFKNTFCSIVYEAFWDEEVVFLTEKINKCFLSGHPFIILSSPKYLSFLKKIGFKTFDRWWDESYDNIEDNRERMVRIKQVVLDISKWSLEKCERVYGEMIPIIKHNQSIVKDMSKNRLNDTYNLIEYKSSVI